MTAATPSFAEPRVWSEIVDDAPAIIAATRHAAAAYRALVGPPPSDAACLDGRETAPDAPLIAILTAWAGGVAAAVDILRARRLFWIHFLGPTTFSEWFPDIRPPAPHELDPAQPSAGTWSQAVAGPQAGQPITSLVSPWPNDVTLALLGHLDLMATLAPLSAGGRIICATPPFATATISG